MKKVWIVVLAVIISGCAGTTQRIGYNVTLDQVDRPANAKDRFGAVNTTTVDRDGKKYMAFNDDMVGATFLFGDTQIGITLENKTDHSIKIKWDEAAWINPNGESKRVMHTGVKYVDRNAPQAPSVIAKHGMINDSVTPTDNVYYDPGKYGGWRELALLHNTDIMAVDMKSELAQAQRYVGKTCGLLLPMEIEGVQNDYVFTFSIGQAGIVDRY